MHIADIVSIITSAGVLGTLLLGFVNLFSLRKSERLMRGYNLKIADYEKRRDFMLSQISKYISLLDVHGLSYMALTDEEYDGKDLEMGKKLYRLETLYFKIKLMINLDSNYFNELSTALDESLELAKKLRTENSMAEFITNGLRTPERAMEISRKALESIKEKTKDDRDESDIVIDVEADDKEILRFISEAVEMRNSHLKNYLSAVTEMDKKKEAIVSVARKYLADEKKQLLNSK